MSGMEDSKGFCVAEEVLSCRLFTVLGPGFHLVTNQWDHKLQNKCNDFYLILRSTLTYMSSMPVVKGFSEVGDRLGSKARTKE